MLGINKKESIENVDIDSFLVKVNCDRTVNNPIDYPSVEEHSQDKFEFMNSIEKDANRRASERKQRESIAQELRKFVSFYFIK